MKRPRICVVGSSNTDMVVKSDRIPAVGETVTGGTFVMAAGGKGANQAVAAARLGADVTFVAKVGVDVFGDQAIAGYQKDGIRTEFISRDSDHATGVALILVNGQGENLISVASGANHLLCPADIDRAAEAIRSADVVVLQLECLLETVIRAAELAAAAGVPVILDPAPAPDGPLPEALMRNVTCIKPNETEAERLTGVKVTDEASAVEAARRLLAAGAKQAIITLGAQGAVVVESVDQVQRIASPQVQAVDSTAAGDAFSGALGCALGQGKTLCDAARFAAVAAALSVTRLGAQPSLPTAAETAEFARRAGIAIS